jgi:FkbM family methyltransferase
MKFVEKVLRKAGFDNPYSEFLNFREYKKIVYADRFAEGKAPFLNSTIEYSDGIGFLHSLHEIFIDEVYKFIPKKENPIIVDCGSNIGLSIIYFKHKFPKAKIIGFEPDARIYSILKRNIQSFGYKDVEIYNTAIWTEETELNFYSEGSLAGSTEINYLEDNNKKYKVKTTDLKKVLSQNKVDFLKIDIEGGENTLMPDIAHSINSIPFIFLEYHGMFDHTQQLGEILNILTESGFRYIIQPAISKVEFPFLDSKKEGFENQLNIFCKKEE